jgi:hypothetical protein
MFLFIAKESSILLLIAYKATETLKSFVNKALQDSTFFFSNVS